MFNIWIQFMVVAGQHEQQHYHYPLFVMLMSTNSYVRSWESLGDHYIYIIGAKIDVRSWDEFGDCHVRLKETTQRKVKINHSEKIWHCTLLKTLNIRYMNHHLIYCLMSRVAIFNKWIPPIDLIYFFNFVYLSHK